MKKLRGFISLLLVMMLVMGLSAVAMAAEGNTYTITIKNESAAHTYEAYQIFKGDLSEDGKLANVQWGSGVKAEVSTAIGAADVKAATLTDETAVKAFAVEIVPYLNSKGFQISSAYDAENKQYTISGLEEGYYLIKDKDNSLDGDDSSYTTYILRLAADETIEPKSEVPSSHKKVDDANDSTSSENAVFWQDSADYDIGDKVPFQLVGTLPSNFGEYLSYEMIFHDELSDGLTFNDDVKVYVRHLEGRVEVARECYDVDFTKDSFCSDGCSFEVKIADLRKLYDAQGTHIAVTKNSIIEVEYTATLNEKYAVIGSKGNPNTMYMEYSNNPNNEAGGETGKTEKDKVIVFTYKTVINKVDGEGNALAGAAFKLEKKMQDGTWVTVKDYTVEDPTDTTFVFAGLDDGIYRITETVTPDGYNSIVPFYFEIVAQHDVESDNPKLTVLNSNQIDEAGLTVTENIIFSATVEKDGKDFTGVISSDIVNKSGTTLPATGGIGTTIFYAAGAILMIGAVVVMVTRRRMMSE